MATDRQVWLNTIWRANDDPQRYFTTNVVHIWGNRCQTDPVVAVAIVFVPQIPWIVAVNIARKIAATRGPGAPIKIRLRDVQEECVCKYRQGQRLNWLANWCRHIVQPIKITPEHIKVEHIH